MKRVIIMVGAFLVLSVAAMAQKSEIFIKGDAAIRGYDPVAYFKEGKPVMGSKQLSYQWKGANWYFANQENLNAFKASPEKYAPQYGGYCAYGTAEGHKAPTETETWTLSNGKLYFNYNDQVKQVWMKDQQAYIIKADKLWPTVKDDEF